ncbi:MAG: glycosyltransferase family 2 protein [Alphaproteobacteria bacterium]|nr:glycosyltransferase family 2 protein [Alphaproteobacteria bacterium]
MQTISLCMIVKDEEKAIGRCLDCVKDIVDEIVIIDTGSTDKTVEIVSKYTDKVYHFEWIDDFAAARNFSFSKATKDYVMWLDADDCLTEENRKKLLELKRTLNPEIDTVMCVYDIAFDANGKPTFSYNRERIMKRCESAVWHGAVHECINPFGKVITSDFAVHHRKEKPGEPGRNLRIYEKKLKNGGEFNPRERYYYSRELYEHKRYKEAINNFKIFLKDGKGWVEDNICACHLIGESFKALSDPDSALQAFFYSFIYDDPRPEICCSIAQHFFDKNNMRQAAYWYRVALENSVITSKRELHGFVLRDCHGYIPAIQLCVCYDRMGDYENSVKYNEMAGSFKPNDRTYLYNKKYFEKKNNG